MKHKQKYEYLSLTVDIQREGLNAMLYKYAALGFRLHTTSRNGNNVFLMFEREIEEVTP